MKFSRLPIVAIGTLATMVAYQNCAKEDGLGKTFLAAKDRTGTVLPSADKNPVPSPTPSPTPEGGGDASGTIDPNCMTNPSFDACVFKKNPVAQNKAPFPNGGISYQTDLSKVQTYGVKITGLDSSGFLQNSSIIVNASSGTRAKANSDKSWKFIYKGDPAHRIAQVMAYYWLNVQVDEMTKRSGIFYAKDKRIPVDSFNTGVVNNAYWDGTNVVMGIFNIPGNTSEAALSADIYLHEFGHANISKATNNSITNDTNGAGNSCFTPDGCAGAINEGQADFHSALIFPDQPALGEAAFNSVSGLTECGIVRDVSKYRSITASQAFNACRGEVHVMGRVYASAWWEIYNASGVNKGDIEKLFSEHLKMLSGSDTFSSARDKIVTADKALFAGKYTATIQQVFQAKGVTDSQN